MTPDEAKALLGAYATGTLTSEEQQALFIAALEDQALFDELAKEQALKEVFDDPAARGELLGALTEGERRSSWRTWWIPAAAGALALAGLTVFVLLPGPQRTAVEVAENRQPVFDAIRSSPSASAGSVVPERTGPPAEKPALERSINPPPPARSAEPEPAPAKKAVSPLADQLEQKERAAQADNKAADNKAKVAQQGAVGGYVQSADTQARQEMTQAPRAQQQVPGQAAEATPANAPAAARQTIAAAPAATRALRATPPPVVNGLRSSDAAAVEEAATGIRHSVEKLADGRFRVSLRSRENGFLYVFHRENGGGWVQVNAGGTLVQAQVSFLTPPMTAGDVMVVFSQSSIAAPDPAALMVDRDGHTAFTITLK